MSQSAENRTPTQTLQELTARVQELEAEKVAMPAVFNEWLRRHNENPDQFAVGEYMSYGDRCTDYYQNLLTNVLKKGV